MPQNTSGQRFTRISGLTKQVVEVTVAEVAKVDAVEEAGKRI